MTAEELRAWRFLLGLSQVRAAEGLFMSRSKYQAMESGQAGISGRTELACKYLHAQWLGKVDPEAAKHWKRHVVRK